MREENELEIRNGIGKHNETVYIVVIKGKVIYASLDEDESRNYADNQEIEARDNALQKMRADEDSSEKDIFEANWKAGYNGCVFQVYRVELFKYEEDDVIYVDGHDIHYNTIVDLMEKEESKHQDEYYKDDYCDDDEGNVLS